MNKEEVIAEVRRMGAAAKDVSRVLAACTAEKKNEGLHAISSELLVNRDNLLVENNRDLKKGKENGLSDALLDRLSLSEARLTEIAEGVSAVTELPDPIGDCIDAWNLENELHIEKVRVPLGVVGIIYEARPNVTVDASVLCLKTGNAVLLRGSSTALYSNRALVKVIQGALDGVGLPPCAVQLVDTTEREGVEAMLSMTEYLSVVIPRGGAGLIDFVVENSSIPVIETGSGNCHVYVHLDADPSMAREIILNAKVQRPSVCNAAETLLVHRGWAKEHLSEVIESLREQKVECRGCEMTAALVPDVIPAVSEDWDTEYLDYIIAIKVVSSLEEAISHINSHGTLHSEAIITESDKAARQFVTEVDAAAVYRNASTRFTDGFVFGFGAEIGISTQKLHARGPMGLSELTSYKYIVSGNGQIRE